MFFKKKAIAREKPPEIDYDKLADVLSKKIPHPENDNVPPSSPAPAQAPPELDDEYADEYDILIDKINNAKSASEIQLHMTKLEAIKEIRKKQRAVINGQRSRMKSQPKSTQTSMTNSQKEGDNGMTDIDIDGLLEQFDNLPAFLKLIVKNVARRYDIDIDNLREHPEQLMGLLQKAQKPPVEVQQTDEEVKDDGDWL
ncbi:MAG: hypothetical protein QXL94_04450 [Candidatus Parvarchaeum sp.]